MNRVKKIIKIYFLINLLIIFTLTGCDSPPILTETYNSTITIEGIEDPQHIEHFTLMTSADQTIIEDDFSPEEVNNQTLTYKLTGVEGNTNITLVIDNENINNSTYENSYQKTITQSNPNITIDLSKNSFQVNFTDPKNGFLNASLNGNPISSGYFVSRGEDIKFTVSTDGDDNEFFEVSKWIINDTDHFINNKTYTYQNIQEDINVSVNLNKISYFDVLVNKDDVNVEISDNIKVTIQYRVENISELEGKHVVIFYVDEKKLSQKEITLNPSEKIIDEFTWNPIVDDQKTFEIKITSDNDSETFYINISRETGTLEVEILWDLPPDAPNNLTAKSGEYNGEQAIELNWNEVIDADSYKIVRRNTSLNFSHFTLIASNINNNKYIDLNLDAEHYYEYKVIAVNENGVCSDYSNIAGPISP